MKSLKILILASGSRGDVQPFVALSLYLKSLGHEIYFCCPPNFEDWIKSFDLNFYSFGHDIQKIAQEHAQAIMDKPIKVFTTFLGLLKEELDLQHKQLFEYMKDKDLAIGASIQLAASYMFEYYKTPFYYVGFCPNLFPSNYHAPITTPILSENHYINKILWFLHNKLLNLPLKKQINKYRKQLNLPQVSDVLNFTGKAKLIVASEEVIAKLPKDQENILFQSGAFHLFNQGKLPEDIENFIEGNKPVIYIGFGSMTDTNPEKTSKMLLEVVKKTGVKLIISKGWAGLGEKLENNENIKVIGSVSHHELFPKMALVIHHGGAGTTNTCAYAGVPQIIVPHLMDQYYWGDKIKKLSIGVKPIPRNKLNTEVLIQNIKKILRNPYFKKNALKIKEKLVKNNGVKNACDFILKDFE
ncbi:MAG: glycosyltransferase [Candidatus Sericytochromatia bacterium]